MGPPLGAGLRTAHLPGLSHPNALDDPGAYPADTPISSCSEAQYARLEQDGHIGMDFEPEVV